MQAPRMLPLLISLLARPISLFTPILAGPSTIRYMAAVVLAMLSEVQAIMAAEAGVKASAENTAAVIKIFFIAISLGTKPAFCRLSGYAFSAGKVSRRSYFCLLRRSKRSLGSPVTDVQC